MDVLVSTVSDMKLFHEVNYLGSVAAFSEVQRSLFSASAVVSSSCRCFFGGTLSCSVCSSCSGFLYGDKKNKLHICGTFVLPIILFSAFYFINCFASHCSQSSRLPHSPLLKPSHTWLPTKAKITSQGQLKNFEFSVPHSRFLKTLRCKCFKI